MKILVTGGAGFIGSNFVRYLLAQDNSLENKPLPVYGDGLHIRDWIHVEDHCRAICEVLLKGRPGEIYNVGAGAQRTNLEVVRTLLRTLGKDDSMITFVEDRPGHDRRYALDSAKLRTELAWCPLYTFEEGLEMSALWYRSHEKWLDGCRSGTYRDFYRRHYSDRTEVLKRPEVRG